MSHARLFLSYGRRDAKELADRLRADLEAHGYEVWQDSRCLRAGTSWEQAIEDGLRSTQLLVALLSPHAVRRTNRAGSADDQDSVCLDEISFARFAHPPKPIVPVMAAPCEPPFCIFRLDYIDLCAWRDSPDQYRAGFGRLLEGVEAALAGEVRYRAWEHQLRPWDFAAFLNEKRRHFCGRQWLFDALDAWRTAHREPALLITGDPGVGKSAFVAELVHRNPGGQVLAYHCCQADTPATLDPGLMVRSLAGMIASRLGAYADLLAEAGVQESLSEARCAADPASAFEAGILAPLQRLHAPEEGVRYLLVDALDEALAPRPGGRSLSIVDVLAARLNRLPPWLRVVATARKDRQVLNRLRGLRAHELDAQDPQNLQDLEAYLTLRLAGPVLAESLARSRRPAPVVARRLRDQSAGNFLYVQQVLEGVERDQYHFDRLDELPPGLYGLYQGFFERHFPDEPRYAAARRVLEVVVAAREPLPEEALAAATGLDREGKLADAFRSLASYLPRREDRYAVYHKSLADWLTDEDLRGTLYHASRRRGHGRLADLGWAEYRQDLDPPSRYTLAHLPTHLLAVERWDDLAELLCDLRFLEAKAEAGLVFDLADDFEEAVRRLPASQARRPVLGLVAEALRADLHFLARHPTALFQCLWNRCWWYDAPEAARHFVPPPNGWPPEGPPWARAGPRLHVLLESWRAGKARAAPGFRWLRSLHPPADPLGTAQRAVLRGHEGGVNSVAVAADPPRLASASSDQTIRIWDWQGGSELACLRGHNGPLGSVTLSPDGHTLASASWDHTVRLWDIHNGQELSCLRGHGNVVTAVAFSADGRFLVSGSWDRSVRIWGVRTARELACGFGHADRVLSVAFSADGSLVASGSCDWTIRIWQAARGVQSARLRGHHDVVSAVVFSPDGRRLVSGGHDHTIRLWDAASGAELTCLHGHEAAVTAVALSTDGRRLASASADRTVRLWDTATGEELACFRGHERLVRSVAFAPDGQRLFSASDDKTVRAWDVRVRGEPAQPRGHQAEVAAVAFSPDGQHLVSTSADLTVRVWDAQGGGEKAHFHSPRGVVAHVTFSPDGSRVAGTPEDGTIRVWETATGRELVCLGGPPEWRWNQLAFARDGHRLAAGSDDQAVRIWETESGRELICLRGHTYAVRSVAFSPDGRRLASGSSDQTVRVWDAETGRELACLPGHQGAVRAVAFAPDGALLASGSDDKTVRLWEAAGGAEAGCLRGHGQKVTAVAFSPCGRRVVSRSGDNTVRLWDVDSRTCLAVLSGVTDEAAVAAGAAQYPWLAVGQQLETLVQSGRTGEAVAWLPIALRHLTTQAGSRAWAGASGSHLYLFTLEGSA